MPKTYLDRGVTSTSPLAAVMLLAPAVALAQATSPFMTGATALQTNILARLRKFGGRCVLGFQSVAQVSSTYGNGDAQTIIENCGNTLILRCSSSEHGGTSQFASRLIGEREVIRRSTARGRDRQSLFAIRGARRSTNVSEQHVIEMAVLPSQIEQLPDLTGYLKTASSRDWVLVRFGATGG